MDNEQSSQRKLPTRTVVINVLPYLFLIVAAAGVFLSAQTAYRKSLLTEEYAYACDQFGYLRMAKEIRTAASQRRTPEFKLESEQTRQLINFMKSSNVPLPLWEEMVAPHAHHYFPQSDAVAVQYPPGTGLTLALFREGSAVYNLNRVIVVVLTATGIAALGFGVWRRAWMSAILVMLGLQVGLSILARVNSVSFSINATLVPILIATIGVLFALKLESRRARLAWLLTLVSGLVLGYAVMVRITTALLVPGLALLLWPRTRPFRLSNLVLPLTLGVVVLGLIPVLWNQEQIAGAWYLPTYGRIDASSPTLARIEHHFSYYFRHEFASADNWALLYAVIGFAGFVLLFKATKNATSDRAVLSVSRLGFAAFLIWALPTVFFLSHSVHGLHYQMPGIFGAVLLVGFGALAIEGVARRRPDIQVAHRGPWVLGLLLMIICAAGSLMHAWRDRTPTPAPSQPVTHKEMPLPAELSSRQAWVWADVLTGTLWYYHQKPAFKIQFSDAPTREKLFRFVFERGDSQFLIADSERMEPFMDEIRKLGGTLEPKGKINGADYFLIQWPATGPHPSEPARTGASTSS